MKLLETEWMKFLNGREAQAPGGYLTTYSMRLCFYAGAQAAYYVFTESLRTGDADKGLEFIDELRAELQEFARQVKDRIV